LRREKRERSMVPVEIELMRSVFLLLFSGIILYYGGYSLWLPILGLPWQGIGRPQDATIAGALLILFIAIGVVGLYSAHGLLLGKGSAWTLSVDLSVTGILARLIFQFEREVTETYLRSVGYSWYLLYAIDIIMLIFLTRPQIKAYYRRE
jgi:hypothetical protein